MNTCIQLYMKQQHFPIKTLQSVEQNHFVYPPQNALILWPLHSIEKKTELEKSEWQSNVSTEGHPSTWSPSGKRPRESVAALSGAANERWNSESKNATHQMTKGSCQQAQLVTGLKAFVSRYILILLKAAFLGASWVFSSPGETKSCKLYGKI